LWLSAAVHVFQDLQGFIAGRGSHQLATFRAVAHQNFLNVFLRPENKSTDRVTPPGSRFKRGRLSGSLSSWRFPELFKIAHFSPMAEMGRTRIAEFTGELARRPKGVSRLSRSPAHRSISRENLGLPALAIIHAGLPAPAALPFNSP